MLMRGLLIALVSMATGEQFDCETREIHAMISLLHHGGRHAMKYYSFRLVSPVYVTGKDVRLIKLQSHCISKFP
jgi:hypothetical protein